ncbi:MBL fold metallo-hydrolase [Streptomyces flavofungini]|uniref:MBL fold metallo-hydrolase n=1 Tax=Streptomyces flavofungini TaxID=68200 RepID=UPI0025B18BB2|nr:MBL fold metallo-hydrolase [Streptomyces flavofungini]WJV44819.1 MBL fold metallo-hydrolase [Streptomyces flavofungini]
MNTNGRTTSPGRRTLLRGAALGAAAPMLASTAAADTGSAARRTRDAGTVTYRWLGTSGWRIDIQRAKRDEARRQPGTATVLVDPYVTRFDTGLFGGSFDPATRLRTDKPLVRRHAGTPEVICVTHTHWDHLNDVPFLAKATGARVIGTETTYHVLRSFGVDAAQLVVVKGGEVLDFDGYVVEVAGSRHSRNAAYSYFAPGTLNAPPATAPRTVADLPEGDTLAFKVTPDGAPSALFMGASDFDERSFRGLAPDIAMLAVASAATTHRYVPRLLDALERPGVIVPVHWDDFERPLAEPPRKVGTDLDDFVTQVRDLSPASRLVVPDYETRYGADVRSRR